MVNDIKNDSSYLIDNVDNNYIVTTKVNYSNNDSLVKQKIYINSGGNIYMVEVMDNNDLIKMKMSIDSIDYNKSMNIDDFKLENNVGLVIDSSITSVSKINDVIYPMYIPQNTYLSSQDKVSIENGERIILTFSGDYPFMLIQETINPNDSSVISVDGDLYQLSNSIGFIDDTSIMWLDNDFEYYLVSNSLNKEQLVDVAESMATVAIIK